MKTGDVAVSVVIPLFNERENVPILYEQLTAVLESLGVRYEILLTDDGSTDGTDDVLSEIAQKDDRVEVLRFRRNRGQTAAMAAAIQRACGQIIVTMDGDLQNDPRDIPALLQGIEAGNDIVVGWRFDRKDRLVSRKVPSRVANWLIGRVTGVSIHDTGCSLKAFRASLISQLPLYSEMHRFIPALASITGARIAEVKVRHHERRFGDSKYGLSRIYKVLLDLVVIKMLVAFSARPLVWFAMLAIPAALAGAALLAFSLYQALVLDTAFSIVLTGTGLVFVALSGFLLVAGLLGELVYRSGELRVESLYSLTAQTVRGHTSRKAVP